MGPITWLYLRMFLFFGIAFGILIALADLLTGKGIQLDQLIQRSFTFGVFMSLILVSFHILGLWIKGVRKFTNENLRVTQKKSIQSDLTLEEFRKKISFDAKLSSMKMNETEHGFELRSGMSLTTWGDLISIEEVSVTGPLNTYQITSKPLLKTTMLDYGTNYGHVTRLEKLVLGKSN